MKDVSMLPISQPCERNKRPILDKLNGVFEDRKKVLEIGSGTGQHAEYFAQEMPHLCWQISDRTAYLENLSARIFHADLTNLPAPIELEVNRHWAYADNDFDAVFTANTLHIMSWDEVLAMIDWLGKILEKGAKVAIYGPFHYEGKATSPSNADFDRSLREKAVDMGIRDFEAVEQEMNNQGFSLNQDWAMPANNRLLFWEKLN